MDPESTPCVSNSELRVSSVVRQASFGSRASSFESRATRFAVRCLAAAKVGRALALWAGTEAQPEGGLRTHAKIKSLRALQIKLHM